MCHISKMAFLSTSSISNGSVSELENAITWTQRYVPSPNDNPFIQQNYAVHPIVQLFLVDIAQEKKTAFSIPGLEDNIIGVLAHDIYALFDSVMSVWGGSPRDLLKDIRTCESFFIGLKGEEVIGEVSKRSVGHISMRICALAYPDTDIAKKARESDMPIIIHEGDCLPEQFATAWQLVCDVVSFIGEARHSLIHRREEGRRKERKKERDHLLRDSEEYDDICISEDEDDEPQPVRKNGPVVLTLRERITKFLSDRTIQLHPIHHLPLLLLLLLTDSVSSEFLPCDDDLRRLALSHHKEFDIKKYVLQKPRGLILTPHNAHLLFAILRTYELDKPLCLIGDSGTGKTLLIRAASNCVSGKYLFELGCNGSTNEKVIIEFMMNVMYKLYTEILNVSPGSIQNQVWKEYAFGSCAAIFFDELNTCESCELLAEIMTKKTIRGQSLDDIFFSLYPTFNSSKSIAQHLRFFAACNPYRQRSKEEEQQTSQVIDKDIGIDPFSHVSYRVYPTPESLRCFVLFWQGLKAQGKDEENRRILERIVISHIKFSLACVAHKNNVQTTAALLSRYSGNVQGIGNDFAVDFMSNTMVDIQSIYDIITFASHILSVLEKRCFFASYREADRFSIVAILHALHAVDHSCFEISHDTHRQHGVLCGVGEDSVHPSVSQSGISIDKSIKSIKFKPSSAWKSEFLRGILVGMYVTFYGRCGSPDARKDLLDDCCTVFNQNDIPFASEASRLVSRMERDSTIPDGSHFNSSPFSHQEHGVQAHAIINSAMLKEIIIHILRTFASSVYSSYKKTCGDTKRNSNAIVLTESLCLNIYLISLAIVLQRAAFLIGAPGTSKTLAYNIVVIPLDFGTGSGIDHPLMKGIRVITHEYQGSTASTSKGVLNLFTSVLEKYHSIFARSKQKNDFRIIPIAFFEELGLAIQNNKNVLKILHQLLEPSNPDDRVTFIALSNYLPDPGKCSRAFVVQAIDPSSEELKVTGCLFYKEVLASCIHVKNPAHIAAYFTRAERFIEFGAELYTKVKVIIEDEIRRKLLTHLGEIHPHDIRRRQVQTLRNFYFFIRDLAWSIFRGVDPPKAFYGAAIANYVGVVGLIPGNGVTRVKAVLSEMLDGHPPTVSATSEALITQNLSNDTRMLLVVGDPHEIFQTVSRILHHLVNHYSSEDIDEAEDNWIGSVFEQGNLPKLFRSYLPKDMERGYFIRVLGDILHNMRNRGVLCMYGMDKVYPALYSLFNYNFISSKGSQRQVRIADPEGYKVTTMDVSLFFRAIVFMDIQRFHSIDQNQVPDTALVSRMQVVVMPSLVDATPECELVVTRVEHVLLALIRRARGNGLASTTSEEATCRVLFPCLNFSKGVHYTARRIVHASRNYCGQHDGSSVILNPDEASLSAASFMFIAGLINPILHECGSSEMMFGTSVSSPDPHDTSFSDSDSILGRFYGENVYSFESFIRHLSSPNVEEKDCRTYIKYVQQPISQFKEKYFHREEPYDIYMIGKGSEVDSKRKYVQILESFLCNDDLIPENDEKRCLIFVFEQPYHLHSLFNTANSFKFQESLQKQHKSIVFIIRLPELINLDLLLSQYTLPLNQDSYPTVLSSVQQDIFVDDQENARKLILFRRAFTKYVRYGHHGDHSSSKLLSAILNRKDNCPTINVVLANVSTWCQGLASDICSSIYAGDVHKEFMSMYIQCSNFNSPQQQLLSLRQDKLQASADEFVKTLDSKGLLECFALDTFSIQCPEMLIKRRFIMDYISPAVGFDLEGKTLDQWILARFEEDPVFTTKKVLDRVRVSLEAFEKYLVKVCISETSDGNFLCRRLSGSKLTAESDHVLMTMLIWAKKLYQTVDVTSFAFLRSQNFLDVVRFFIQCRSANILEFEKLICHTDGSPVCFAGVWSKLKDVTSSFDDIFMYNKLQLQSYLCQILNNKNVPFVGELCKYYIKSVTETSKKMPHGSRSGRTDIWKAFSSLATRLVKNDMRQTLNYALYFIQWIYPIIVEALCEFNIVLPDCPQKTKIIKSRVSYLFQKNFDAFGREVDVDRFSVTQLLNPWLIRLLKVENTENELLFFSIFLKKIVRSLAGLKKILYPYLSEIVKECLGRVLFARGRLLCISVANASLATDSSISGSVLEAMCSISYGCRWWKAQKTDMVVDHGDLRRKIAELIRKRSNPEEVNHLDKIIQVAAVQFAHNDGLPGEHHTNKVKQAVYDLEILPRFSSEDIKVLYWFYGLSPRITASDQDSHKSIEESLVSSLSRSHEKLVKTYMHSMCAFPMAKWLEIAIDCKGKGHDKMPISREIDDLKPRIPRNFRDMDVHQLLRVENRFISKTMEAVSKHNSIVEKFHSSSSTKGLVEVAVSAKSPNNLMCVIHPHDLAEFPSKCMSSLLSLVRVEVTPSSTDVASVSFTSNASAITSFLMSRFTSCGSVRPISKSVWVGNLLPNVDSSFSLMPTAYVREIVDIDQVDELDEYLIRRFTPMDILGFFSLAHIHDICAYGELSVEYSSKPATLDPKSFSPEHEKRIRNIYSPLSIDGADCAKFTLDYFAPEFEREIDKRMKETMLKYPLYVLCAKSIMQLGKAFIIQISGTDVINSEMISQSLDHQTTLEHAARCIVVYCMNKERSWYSENKVNRSLIQAAIKDCIEKKQFNIIDDKDTSGVSDPSIPTIYKKEGGDLLLKSTPHELYSYSKFFENFNETIFDALVWIIIHCMVRFPGWKERTEMTEEYARYISDVVIPAAEEGKFIEISVDFWRAHLSRMSPKVLINLCVFLVRKGEENTYARIIEPPNKSRSTWGEEGDDVWDEE
ncbi:E3 ubiquitin-protein ligase RNF213 like protein [Aduncisulcus paluster]|uniref:E3 ubiquitin-protein ligase RNF213 like protein n=1 Tax=Aduncisulcus paluster TaxID=2918883 RepID=A0ABQ5KQ85_9EUKA|nr:E3 ubiquitin-protein ligase RNF213 like protein [Aduncisulcus paluster]